MEFNVDMIAMVWYFARIANKMEENADLLLNRAIFNAAVHGLGRSIKFRQV